MKVEYRGFDIDCSRERCLAGYKLLYYSVFRQSDGYELTSGYTEGSDLVRDYVRYMKNRVDGFLVDPSEEMSETPDDEDYYDVLAEHRLENEKTQCRVSVPRT